MIDVFFLLIFFLRISMVANIILYYRNSVLEDEYKEMSIELKTLLFKYEEMIEGECDSSGNGEKETIKWELKHIEGELNFFHETKKELLDRIIADPTGEKATSILADRRITHMERIVKEIDSVYHSLPKDKKRLVKLLYWTHTQELTWDGIAKKLHISKRQAQRWRRSIVEAIAERLGWR